MLNKLEKFLKNIHSYESVSPVLLPQEVRPVVSC